MTCDSKKAWSAFAPAAIPTKTHVPALSAFVAQLRSTHPARTVLDVGCGVGTISAMLLAEGLDVVGVDINAAALERARHAAAQARFYLRDASDASGLRLDREGPFDLVICQLLISIIGPPDERRQLLRNVRAVLAPPGQLFLSASGRSDDINPEYARLYAQDRLASGEDGTYFSRGDDGAILYATHHFTEDELRILLLEEGFADVELRRSLEQSSRRPAEAAWFFYATCLLSECSRPQWSTGRRPSSG
jgi:SAM-dependent methyltransferase